MVDCLGLPVLSGGAERLFSATKRLTDSDYYVPHSSGCGQQEDKGIVPSVKMNGYSAIKCQVALLNRCDRINGQIGRFPHFYFRSADCVSRREIFRSRTVGRWVGIINLISRFLLLDCWLLAEFKLVISKLMYRYS